MEFLLRMLEIQESPKRAGVVREALVELRSLRSAAEGSAGFRQGWIAAMEALLPFICTTNTGAEIVYASHIRDAIRNGPPVV